MENQTGDTLDTEVQGLLADGLGFLESLAQPWRFYQLLIVLGLFLAAHLLAKLVHPRLDRWMRGLEGMRPSQLRFLILISRRLRGSPTVSSGPNAVRPSTA